MHAVAEPLHITEQFQARKRAIVSGWIWRTATDPRLRHGGGLPGRELVDCICDVVEFLGASIQNPSSHLPQDLASISERCSRTLWSLDQAPSQVALEFGHVRAAILEALLQDACGGELREELEELEQISVLCDTLVAQVLERFATLETGTRAAKGKRAGGENTQREFTLAVVGHELRSQLTPVATWIDLLALTARTDATDKEHTVLHACCGLQRSVRSLKRLVDDLNDYAALTRDRLALRLVALDLRALAGDCVESFEPHARQAGVSLSVAACEQPLMVKADEIRLQQCLLNLLNNAIKFTPAGGAISVRLTRQDARGAIEVADTGNGMLPAELALLFEPFQQFENGRGAGGLGLGLAIVKSIVRLHGGNIKVHSPGRGSGATFRIELPLLRA